MASDLAHADSGFDPVDLAVMANRLRAITREMANTAALAARSAVVGVARDFSCAILSAGAELIESAEGLPIHIFGIDLQARSMLSLHPDLAAGDAFLHNDPYLGNSHPADHTILAPVFFAGRLAFIVAIKAHQADCGNSIPSTYHAGARDVYEEGSLTFPCVRVQRNYVDNDDIVRMCRRRIRVPEQWHGDYLAMVGAARVGERRLTEFVEKHGTGRVRAFVAAWFDYGERRTVEAIRRLPKGRIVRKGRFDPLPPMLPEGLPLSVAVDIDPGAARITIDLRDNPDCVDCGINQSEATATANALTGVFNCLDWDIPHNAGSIRRIDVLLRKNCVAGIPRFPHSCSTATTLLADVLINLVQSAFGELGDGYGLSEGNCCNSAGVAVISGKDRRRGGAPYINQLFLMGGGGPASAHTDGMVYYLSPPGAGLFWRDSVEIDEQRFPMLIKSMALVRDSAGPGRHRGGPATRCVFGPRFDEMTVITISNGRENPPRGVLGGCDAGLAANHKILEDGSADPLPGLVFETVRPGEWIAGRDNGGGGYGDPLARDPARVLDDVVEGYESRARAEGVYGVAFTGEAGTLVLDLAETERRRATLRTRAGA